MVSTERTWRPFHHRPAWHGHLRAALVFHYKGAQERMYTGLQVAKDPGVWVVWLGCLLMVVGIYVAFLMSHRRIWVRVENGTVTVGGNASKNQAGFQLFMERLVTKLKNQFSTEDNK